MPNPFIGAYPMNSPSAITDPVGDASDFTSTPYHVGAFLVFALVIIVALKMSGFRAMVGIGRG